MTPRATRPRRASMAAMAGLAATALTMAVAPAAVAAPAGTADVVPPALPGANQLAGWANGNPNLLLTYDTTPTTASLRTLAGGQVPLSRPPGAATGVPDILVPPQGTVLVGATVLA